MRHEKPADDRNRLTIHDSNDHSRCKPARARAPRAALPATRQLAPAAGFNECLDFGGTDKSELLESLALCWLDLAIVQGHGGGMAFKVVRR